MLAHAGENVVMRCGVEVDAFVQQIALAHGGDDRICASEAGDHRVALERIALAPLDSACIALNCFRPSGDANDRMSASQRLGGQSRAGHAARTQDGDLHGR